MDRGDIAAADPPAAHYALWHDRAVFHFLTSAADRAGYLAHLRVTLAPDGQAVFGVFAPKRRRAAAVWTCAATPGKRCRRSSGAGSCWKSSGSSRM